MDSHTSGRLLPSAEALPPELTARRHWVVWRLEERDGKATKVPYSAKTGKHASSTDSATWSMFTEARRIADRQKQRFHGVGYVFAGEHVGVDLDHCRDPASGAIEPWALAIVRELDTYTEISPSGTGLHLIARGKLPPGARRRGRVEAYDGGRYFTMTGWHLDGTPRTIEARQAALEAFHAEWLAEPPPVRLSPRPVRTAAASLDDATLLAKAQTAANGADFTRLWNGDWSGYSSQSEADLALCSCLAFWTNGDAGRVDRLFRQSKLYRGKWDARHFGDGKSYGQATIAKALSGAENGYQPRSTVTPAHTEDGAPSGAAPKPAPARLRLRRLADVAAEEVDYLPGEYIPKGMLALFVGDPGNGKTRAVLDLAAQVTCGRAWPEGSAIAEPANVLFCGHEDTLEHIIRPVFDAMGGDATRFFAIDALVKEAFDGTEKESAFSLTPEGIEALEAQVAELRPALMIIDPITGHLGRVDSFKDADVRAALMPLARLAGKYGMAVVGIAHLNKAQQQAVAYRIGASIAFRAVARSVFYVAPDPTDPTGIRKVLFHDKSNIGAQRPARGFAVVDRDGAGVVAWDRNPVTCSLPEALSAAATSGGEDRREQTEAERFLHALLAAGPMDATEVFKQAKEAGIAERTLKRAKDAIRVQSGRSGFGPGGNWRWSLPTTKEPDTDAHSVPARPSMDTTASYGPLWPSRHRQPPEEPPIEDHRMPKGAMLTKEGGPGLLCTECGNPAARRWKGEPRCFSCHPLGSVAPLEVA